VPARATLRWPDHPSAVRAADQLADCGHGSPLYGYAPHPASQSLPSRLVNGQQRVIPGAPVNVGWLVLVATEAVRFFSVQYHSEILDEIGKSDLPGIVTPFSLAEFLSYLQSHGFPDAWPRIPQIRRLVNAMIQAGVLVEVRRVSQEPLVGMGYFTERLSTKSQAVSYLWLSEVLGAQLIIPAYGFSHCTDYRC
jgi:hypothetical protein